MNFAIICALAVLAAPVFAAKVGRGVERIKDPHSGRDADVVQDEILIKFKDTGKSKQQKQDFFDQNDVEELDENTTIKYHRLKRKAGAEKLEKLIDRLNKHGEIEYAEPNYLNTVEATQPNDVAYADSQQWAFQQSNIDLERAWDIDTGSGNIIVAVIDQGLDVDHVDLRDNIWVNPSPTKGDINGWDCFDGDSDPRPDYDTEVHGTQVAGCVGAQGNNAIGISGVNWNVSIMALRCGYNTLPNSATAEAMIYAADHGAAVINMSFGSYSFSYTQLAAIEYAYSKNVVLVGSAGNDSGDTIHYPSAFTQVIGVGATDKTKPDSIASFSNYRYPNVDVVAPGTSIRTTTNPDSQYASSSGTSFSGPIVAGCVALLIDQYQKQGKSYDPLEIKHLLRSTAQQLPRDATAGDSWAGWGRIKIYDAILQLYSGSRTTVYVSDAGNSANPFSGNPATAYPTIAAALAGVNQDLGRDTIVVYSQSVSDSYLGGVYLGKGTRLVSAKQLFGTDTGPGGDTWPRLFSKDTDVIVMADKSRVEGFIIGDTRTYSIASGIWMKDAAAGLIDNVQIEGVKYGVYWENVSGCTISNSIFRNDGNSGIFAYIVNQLNRIYNNRFSGMDTGISIYSMYTDLPSLGTIIDSNYINATWNGIRIIIGENVQICSNTVIGSTNEGIRLEYMDSSLVRGNQISPASNYGMVVTSTNRNLTISENVISGGTWATYFGGTSEVTLRNNLIRNANQGVLIAAGTVNIKIKANQISGNNYGLRFFNAAGCTVAISQNNISGNSVNNIRNETNDSFTLSRNWFGTTVNNATTMKLTNTASGTIAYVPYRLGQVDTAPAADTISPKIPTGLSAVYLPGQIILTWDTGALDEDGSSCDDLQAFRLYRTTNASDSNWKTNAYYANCGTGTSYIDTNITAGVTYHYRLTAVDNASWENESYFSDTIAAIGPKPSYSGPVWVVSVDTGSDSALQANGSGTWPFASITRAMLTDRSGDTVYVYPGLYSETVVIDTNYVSIIGGDSRTTIINPPGDSTVANLYGIYAINRIGLVIRNLAVYDANQGIYFNNVDSALLESDSVSWVYSSGLFDGAIVLYNGSRYNTVRNCYLTKNGHALQLVDTSDTNLVEYNTVIYNRGNGITMANAGYNTVRYNTASNNNYAGIGVTATGSNNIISANITAGNGQQGISMFNSSNANTVTGNLVQGNATQGVDVTQNSAQNIIRNNSILGSGLNGIRIDGSNNNQFYQNDISGNNTGITISGTSAGDTGALNNITGNTTAVSNTSGSIHTLSRNWWGTINVAVDSIVQQPLRTSLIDTSANGDSAAPAPPNGLIVTTGNNSCTVSWTAPLLDENGGVLSGLNGYKVYRFSLPDTANWYAYLKATVTETRFCDTTVVNGETWFYRVTGYDQHVNGITFTNESGHSDTLKVQMPALASFTVIASDYSVANLEWFTLFITARDQFGNTFPHYSGKVNISANTGTVSSAGGDTVSPNFITGTCTELAQISPATAIRITVETAGVSGSVWINLVLDGMVRLQARSNHSVCTVWLTNNTDTYYAVPDIAGAFQISGFMPDTYYLFADYSGYLRERYDTALVMNGSLSGIDLGVLRAGDCNEDNTIDTADFNALRQVWQQSAPANPRTDPDLNNRVNATDLSIVIGNWNRIGD